MDLPSIVEYIGSSLLTLDSISKEFHNFKNEYSLSHK